MPSDLAGARAGQDCACWRVHEPANGPGRRRRSASTRDDVLVARKLLYDAEGRRVPHFLSGSACSLRAYWPPVTRAPKHACECRALLSLGVARVSEFVEGRLLHRHRSVPVEAARMSTTQMASTTPGARKELGSCPAPRRPGAAGLRALVRRQRLRHAVATRPHRVVGDIVLRPAPSWPSPSLELTTETPTHDESSSPWLGTQRVRFRLQGR